MTKCFHAVVALSLLTAMSGHADGGAILARRAINGLEVTIFASPVPPRAGPVDVSVLVQRDESAILDAEVKVAWRTLSSSPPDWLPPCCHVTPMKNGCRRSALTPTTSFSTLLSFP